MARYIDADRLIADGWRLERHGISNKLLQVMSIADVPTADVEEGVRCKDCKHWIYWADSKTCSCKIHHIRTMKDDFCSYGERRTDNDL